MFALTGAAFGAGTGEFDVPTAANFYAGDYGFTFCIGEDDVTRNESNVITGLTSGNVLALYAGSYSGSQYYTNGFVFSVSGGAITLSVGRGTLSGLPSETSSIQTTTNFTIGSAAEDGGAITTTEGAALTLEIGKSYTIKNVVNTGVGVTNNQNISIFETGSDTVLGTIAYKGNMHGGNAQTTMSVWGNTSYDVARLVPEPTTATLSLLALAGLAARRRR